MKITQTLSAVAIALVLAGPAFAEGGGENNNFGLPSEAVAMGQSDYTIDATGHFARHEIAPATQTAQTDPAHQLSSNSYGRPAQSQGNGW